MNAKLLHLVCCGLLAAAVALGGQVDLEALVNSMPNADKSPDGKHTGPPAEAALEAVKAVIQGGRPAVAALIAMLKDPTEGEDYKAHYLLHAVATHARRPEAEAEPERKMVAEALAAALEGQRPTIVKMHILEELLYIGGEEPVPALTKLLLDPELYDYAVRALQARKLAPPLRAALPRAAGRNRVALIQALGELRDAEAAPTLLPLVSRGDPDTRLAAAEALASIGDPKAVDALLGAARLDKASHHEMKLAEAALRLGQRLAEAGQRHAAKRIYATLPAQYPGRPGRHVRCACLAGLVAVAGDEVLPELLAAIADPDPQVRAMGEQVARSLAGRAPVEQWVALMKKSAGKDRAGALFILGAIGDPQALPAILEAIADKDEAVRHEALEATAAIGGEAAAKTLIARLAAPDRAEQQAAFECLIKCRGDGVNPAIAAAAKSAPEATLRARLVEVIGARRALDQMPLILSAAQDESPAVRAAAARALQFAGGESEVPALVKILKGAREGEERGAAEQALIAIGLRARDQVANQLVAELKEAPPDAAGVMLRVLARLGGTPAAKAIAQAADSPDPKVKDEAVRALGNWASPDGIVVAADGLLKVAQTAADLRHHVLALRNYIALARSESLRRDPERQLKMFGEALAIAKRADEKRAALAGLGELREPRAVKLATSCLGDPDVAEEAAAAAVRIASQVKNKADRDVQAALKAVLDAAKNPATLKEAQKLLSKKP